MLLSSGYAANTRLSIRNFKAIFVVCRSMAPVDDYGIELEYKRVTDMDMAPRACIACGFGGVIRRSYKFIDRQDLGTPFVKRILRHERVLWECKKCGKQFTISNPRVPFDSGYTDDVKKYVSMRVLEKGDSMHRVASDLLSLHNITIKMQTIHAWINECRARDGDEKRKQVEPAIIEHSGALSLDATFKTVHVKKNDRMTTEVVRS